jgi:hypothetical protein
MVAWKVDQQVGNVKNDTQSWKGSAHLDTISESMAIYINFPSATRDRG